MGPKDIRDTVRDDIRRMTGYAPGEQINQAIKLNTNECAWPAAPAVIEVLHTVAADPLRLYPDPRSRRIRETAAALAGVEPDQVLAGNGSDDCLTILYRSLLVPGDRIRCPWPTYGLYDTCATIQGTTLERIPWAGLPATWELPPGLDAPGARLVVLANPNNPSGTLIGVDRLRALADACPGILVVDEAYVDFAPAGSSILPFLDKHPNLVVLRTCSKSYALAGARLGLLFAHADLVSEFMKVKDSYNINALTQAIGAAALAEVDWHAELVRRSIANRGVLATRLTQRGWTALPSAANFILFHVGPEAEGVYRALRERGILIRWWNTPELREHLRISVGSNTQQTALFTALDEILA